MPAQVQTPSDGDNLPYLLAATPKLE